MGVSETSIRELEKLGHIVRHVLMGLTSEVFYKEELDDYLDRSRLKESFQVVEPENGKKSEGRGDAISSEKATAAG